MGGRGRASPRPRPSVITAWSGTYELPASAAPVAIVVRVQGTEATVSLGPGHMGATNVQVVVTGTRIRFNLPGLPQPVAFDGTVRSGDISGSVRQGALTGAFTLHKGMSRIVSLLGSYRSAGGADAAVVEADGLAPFLVELPSGATHGVGPSLTVGKLLGRTSGDGRIAVDATGFTWNGTHYARLRLRQREVRIGVDAATLTIPPGQGPFPAVVMVHGSGERTRDEFDVFTSYFALNGVAVVADDKRGVGESEGRYPGDAATSSAIDVLARDTQAEVRFAATLPQIDASRIGLFGDSQAGWIVPLAASRESAVHWAILNSGPTVTVGESDFWGRLAGESESPPSGTRAAMLAQVEQEGPSGFDPLPYLRSLSIPILWMYGSDDRNIPTELCLERIASVKAGHEYSTVVLPTTHTPLVLPSGLLSSLSQSPGFDPRYFPALAAWLQREGITR
jgi:uncharacterized protein